MNRQITSINPLDCQRNIKPAINACVYPCKKIGVYRAHLHLSCVEEVTSKFSPITIFFSSFPKNLYSSKPATYSKLFLKSFRLYCAVKMVRIKFTKEFVFIGAIHLTSFWLGRWCCKKLLGYT